MGSSCGQRTQQTGAREDIYIMACRLQSVGSNECKCWEGGMYIGKGKCSWSGHIPRYKSEYEDPAHWTKKPSRDDYGLRSWEDWVWDSEYGEWVVGWNNNHITHNDYLTIQRELNASSTSQTRVSRRIIARGAAFDDEDIWWKDGEVVTAEQLWEFSMAYLIKHTQSDWDLWVKEYEGFNTMEDFTQQALETFIIRWTDYVFGAKDIIDNPFSYIGTMIHNTIADYRKSQAEKRLHSVPLSIYTILEFFENTEPHTMTPDELDDWDKHSYTDPNLIYETYAASKNTSTETVKLSLDVMQQAFNQAGIKLSGSRIRAVMKALNGQVDFYSDSKLLTKQQKNDRRYVREVRTKISKSSNAQALELKTLLTQAIA
jgi:hypothetical protein